MKRVIRATTNPNPSGREKRNAALARRIGAEGIVLLENDGTLPLRDKEIALYGFGARHTCYGGTGSGENHPRYRVNVEEGLESAGYVITTKGWLDDFDASYHDAYNTWHKNLVEGLKKCKKLEQMDYASANPFIPPLGRDISLSDKKASHTENAVYVLTRQAGEGADRRTEKGDYYICDRELAQLEQLCGLYDHVVLLLNICGVMDLSFMKRLKLAAVVLTLQGGMEAGNSVADVLSGKVNPCGKLTDTWAERYEDYPCHDTYSYRSGNAREEDYTEGIFVGYRWFDVNGIVPRYPFGYGLSYTAFEIRYVDVAVDGSQVVCRAAVRNRGDIPGREVVQLYLSAPDGHLKKERQVLVSFNKTEILKHGEEQEIELPFDLHDCSSYDQERSVHILEKGDYVLRLGDNSRNAQAVIALSLDREVITEKHVAVCPVRKQISVYQPEAGRMELPDLQKVIVDADSIPVVEHCYPELKPLRDCIVEGIVGELSIKEKCKLLVGASYLGPVYNTVFGAGGNTTSAFLKKGIPNMPMTDGPQGINVTPKSLKPKQNILVPPALPEALNYGLVGWFSNLTIPKENTRSTVYYQYGTAWPGETVAAQTWDTELLYEQGRAIGEEMEEFGVVYWLGPAINLHRNPLCGRNYEYYGEDPLLTGKLAAAVTKGVQSHKGCYATLKHFACNNLETERNQSSSNLEERTLREIYLKGFQIAVQEGHAKGIMASYNKVNGTYLPNNSDLLIKVLRNEWGFDGVVMTDWFAAGHDESRAELSCKYGCDLVMPGMPTEVNRILQALKKGDITEADIEKSVRRVIKSAIESCVADS